MKKRWENPDVTELSLKATEKHNNNDFGGDEFSPIEKHNGINQFSGEKFPTNPFQPPMNGGGNKPGHNGKH